MPGKLIKYDLKASAKILIFIHLLYLVLCISIRLFFIDRPDFTLPAKVLFTPVLICAVMVFLVIFVLWFSTWLLFISYRDMEARVLILCGIISRVHRYLAEQSVWSQLLSPMSPHIIS